MQDAEVGRSRQSVDAVHKLEHMTMPSPGKRVMALFRMRSHHTSEGHTFDEEASLRYFPVEAAMQRYRWPKVGWSVRWLPAVVVEVKGAQVCVHWDHPHWIDWADGERVAAPKTWVSTQMLQDLASDGESTSTLGGWEPMLSIVEVRWGDLRRPVEYHPDSWASFGSTISPPFIASMHETLFRCAGQAYEVLSVFVSRSSDLTDVSEVFIRTQLCGRHIAALVFLWASNPGDVEVGYLDCAVLYGFMRRLESVGMPIRWPHASHMSELLASKSWLPSRSRDLNCKVPATTRVCRSAVVRDSLLAAQNVLRQLAPLAKEQGLATATGEKAVCVTKLGYTYEARCVVECIGAAELSNALTNLADQYPYHDSIMVQARVPNFAVELRVGVVHGEVMNITYTRMATVSEQGYFTEFLQLPREKALAEWLSGDEEALASAEAQAGVLSRLWWSWLKMESSETLVSVRLDFLVCHIDVGLSEVWTCEVGEQGYSPVGWEGFPGVVFPHIFASCLEDINCDCPDCGCGQAMEAISRRLQRDGLPTRT
uniref:Uncharacterized protein n=1 Tax=Noctiluca scintillans TaxID=2966 RepID=A0A7S1FIZ4_NOCSC|mmetsp:Transcript_7859/g.21601  ORF Transcript_7859/g.21601 Transcript_7859/m.21601 type:complete len:540 (+) Transcript_7859:59-1678(+)|eukprot:CAMPEP_0194487384 /NCGR_PEP_ID=MMETSP0253-20130528/7678_1 /TAXON_ID=2966 /ORGANISM="Noctiluca scintillans" /LENGTH=539 /DNA_ID=CAMNT_0039327597 /DNA_START=8 /DNA_END=1627 /DNA_ORIENTATION=-